MPVILGAVHGGVCVDQGPAVIDLSLVDLEEWCEEALTALLAELQATFEPIEE